MEIKYVNVNDIVIPKVRFRSSGNEELIDYSSTKGAIVAFTRSLSQSLICRSILLMLAN